MEEADTWGLQDKAYSTKYQGSYFDDDIVPQVRLENGLDMAALRQGEGAEFSIDGSEVPIECELGEYESKDVYKYLNPDMGDMYEEEEGEGEEGDDDLSPFERRAKTMVDVTPDQDGGVLKKVQKEGTGDVINEDAFVTVHYNMYLEHQDEPADSTFLRNRPLRFPLGKGNVVEGMDVAIRSMRVNESACFLFKPQYFLGQNGCPPRIPGNSTAMFHIQLKASEDSGGADEYYSMTAAERREASFNLVKQVALREKEEGNSHFKGERFSLAVRCYNRAIRITEECRLQNDDEERMQQKFLFQLYKNVALSCMKLNKGKLAITNINNALYIDRSHAQAFYIKGKALSMVGDYEAAKRELLHAKKLKPNDHDIANELKQLDITSQKYSQLQANMYKRMFFGDGPEKKAGKSGKKKEKELVTDRTAPSKVDDEYRNIVTQKLQAFKMSMDTDVMALPVDLSSTQLYTLEEVCQGMGLEIEMKGSDTNVHFLVTKPKGNKPVTTT